MRAELPWNVAGIPPEAREAARAAARREGLPLGEWLTRRILRSLSNMDEDTAPASYEGRGPTVVALDNWGVPSSAISRRDGEEMARSETDSNASWRRIEEQLRELSRRLESSERAQGESNRVLSHAAQEMNLAAREQFDRLGLNMMALSERLERLERSAGHDGLKEAIKALHQGLSRLAEQITITANDSAGQVAQLSAHLEQLAGRIGQARLDAENADKALDSRMNAMEEALDARLTTLEHAAQFGSNALDHALEKIDAAINQQAGDQLAYQKHAAQQAESLQRLEEAIARLQTQPRDGELERRLQGIERSISSMADRLEEDEAAQKFDAVLQALACRLEALERDHHDLLGQLRPQTSEPVEVEVSSAEVASPEGAGAAELPAEVEMPPLAEPAPDAPDHPEAVEGPLSALLSSEIADPVPEPDFAPDFSDVFVDQAEQENFLAEARRTAHAAAQQAENERRGRFADFRWSREGEENAPAEKPRPPFLIPVLVALLIVLVAGTALVLNQRKALQQAAAPIPVRAHAAPVVKHAAPLAVTPQVHAHASEPANASVLSALSLNQNVLDTAPVATASKQAPSDRVAQLARQGNPAALTILGLKALDGAADKPGKLADAVRFLTQAAEKGQAVAQYRLATLYERGQGVAADPAKAAHWYELSAAQGNRKAMHNLAVAYASGLSGKKNMAEAARWFAKAAALGLSDSQFNLAVLYERGDGVPQSLADAYKWYAIAAEAGDSESKSRIAVLETQLSAADKAAAGKSVASFHVAPLNGAANVPPQPADLGS